MTALNGGPLAQKSTTLVEHVICFGFISAQLNCCVVQYIHLQQFSMYMSDSASKHALLTL